MGNAAEYIPALKYGHQIYPQNIAGMLGLPKVGNIFYVDPGTGSDSDSGTSPTAALATVAEAIERMTADQDDVAVIMGTSSTGRTTETAAVAWSKRRTHLIGNGPARRVNSRNGVNVDDTDTTSAFVISATNCSFSNISIAAFNDADVMVEITAGNNTFNNVHFQGMGNATAAAEATARSVLITGAGENEFNNCTIGLDTVTRSAANASLEVTGSSARNVFRNCLFPCFTDDAGAFWVKADTGNAYERFLIFENCIFTNAISGSSTTMTVGMDLSATGNGEVLMINSIWHGATDLTNTVTNVYTNNPIFDTNDQGKATVHANS